jgi:hypothetical protein
MSAGWRSPVSRQTHNLEVAGPNPAPATGRPDDEQLLTNIPVCDDLEDGLVPWAVDLHLPDGDGTDTDVSAFNSSI